MAEEVKDQSVAEEPTEGLEPDVSLDTQAEEPTTEQQRRNQEILAKYGLDKKFKATDDPYEMAETLAKAASHATKFASERELKAHEAQTKLEELRNELLGQQRPMQPQAAPVPFPQQPSQFSQEDWYEDPIKVQQVMQRQTIAELNTLAEQREARREMNRYLDETPDARDRQNEVGAAMMRLPQLPSPEDAVRVYKKIDRIIAEKYKAVRTTAYDEGRESNTEERRAGVVTGSGTGAGSPAALDREQQMARKLAGMNDRKTRQEYLQSMGLLPLE